MGVKTTRQLERVSRLDPIQMAVRDALFAFMAATAQAEAIREAQTAGIKAAMKAAGGAATKYKGRKPTFDVEQLHRTSELLSMGMSPSAISAEIGIPRATVYRIRDDPVKAVALMQTWFLVGGLRAEVANDPENTSAAGRRA